MELLSKYFRERDGGEVILFEGSFLAYRIVEDQFFITEFYLDEAKRNSPKHVYGLMRKAHEVAVNKDCRYFTAIIPKSHAKLSETVAMRIRFGFKITNWDSNGIHLALPLQECEWVAEE